MASIPENAASDLVREAWRLRFADAALEARFREERLATGETRARVMALVAVLIVGLNGWNDARSLARTMPDVLAEDLRLRFFVMVPAFFAIAFSPGLRGHARRADVVNATAIVAICWANALIYWHVAVNAQGTAFAGQVLGSVLPILVIAVFGLPLGFRAMLAMVGGTAAGIVAWFFLTLGPEFARGVNSLVTSLPLMSVAAALLGWWRERGERTMFAQREQVRRLAKELEASNAQLARVNGEQAEFMSIAAHDLRAPLATVRGYAQLLRGGRLKETEAQGKALGEIETQATRMLSLVSDYLGTHAAAGAAPRTRVMQLDLAASAQAAVVRHALVAASKGQTLRAGGGERKEEAAGDGGEAWAWGDEESLAQVADNFVTNALKFSRRGAAVRIVVGRRDEDGDRSAESGVRTWVRLAVVDAGPGIAGEEQAGLFKKFGRASTKPTGGETSHGLGLAVTKRLAEAMGGRVGCESRLGEGATFWVELPAVGAEEMNARVELGAMH